MNDMGCNHIKIISIIISKFFWKFLINNKVIYLAFRYFELLPFPESFDLWQFYVDNNLVSVAQLSV